MLILDVGYNLIFTSSRCRIQDTVNGIIDNVTVTRDVRYNVTLRPEGGGGGKNHFFSSHVFDQSCWRGTRRKKPDRNLTLCF